MTDGLAFRIGRFAQKRTLPCPAPCGDNCVGQPLQSSRHNQRAIWSSDLTMAPRLDRGYSETLYRSSVSQHWRRLIRLR
jgi:hypothetical protein